MSRYFDKVVEVALNMRFVTDDVAIIEAQSRAEIAAIQAQSAALAAAAAQVSHLRDTEDRNKTWRGAYFKPTPTRVSHNHDHDNSSGYGDGGEPGNYICTSWP